MELMIDPRNDAKRKLGRCRRIVVKVGSGVIAGRGRLRPKVLADLAYDVTVLRHKGYEVVMVVSGAVAAGYTPLGLAAPPASVVERQAAASIGQHKLMALLATAFAKNRTHVAQLLMAADDIEDRRRFLSARHTLQRLLASGVVPIINENDALSDNEDKVGDNDLLASLVTNVVSANLLIVLSTAGGIWRNGNPDDIIPRVEVGSSIDEHLTDERSATGVGGIHAKTRAARLASHWGVPTIIVPFEEGMIQRVLAGDEVGTMFVPREARISQRKRWIVIQPKSHGAIRVDDAAREAILKRNASLLSTGVADVTGNFGKGARVDLVDDRGAVFAVGLASYAADEIRRLRGKKPAEIKAVLGYEYVREIVDHDDMVLLVEEG
jgi:glutamate 5-kinase